MLHFIFLLITASLALPSDEFCGGVSSNWTSVHVEDHERTTLRCVQSMAKIIRVVSNGSYNPHFVLNSRGDTSLNTSKTVPTCATNSNDFCQLKWIREAALFSGVGAVIFVGDSTLMRTYMYIRRASDEDYTQKVKNMEGVLNDTITLSSGRTVPMHFFRLLHLSRSVSVVHAAFDLAEQIPRSLVVFTCGPHDTSWLVFRKPMPSFRRGNVGSFSHAKLYWLRYSQIFVNTIAFRLMLAEERALNVSKVQLNHSTTFLERNVMKKWYRPTVVFREQYLPNCAHPKYSRYPLITRCKDLLLPHVVPFYRRYLQFLLNRVNIPVVGVDALMPPCLLQDAGHLVRWCKRFEVQMLFQAFRILRRAGVVQGYKLRGPKEPTPGAETTFEDNIVQMTDLHMYKESAINNSVLPMSPLMFFNGKEPEWSRQKEELDLNDTSLNVTLLQSQRETKDIPDFPEENSAMVVANLAFNGTAPPLGTFSDELLFYVLVALVTIAFVLLTLIWCRSNVKR